ncbi:UDP-2,3-diacylglucosamine diphosphatase [Pleionea sp. CnH1-48]|uniref:UDP-2,3-diacylglucosamine diphosphatase n=1 Tax=Pleionea sp. CnH1-48 TaxID=2954494 RepID=UPI002096E90C|nr:UDP-2,3-diacylglucosamine diphosphatase [Pleionea sp. CnH1-48]MCO7222942.1 UDP-2,3-diacylglucosamine diphosphatase [Pleionea sp. CnH1-48]
MTIHLISDLHLCDDEPHLLQLFQHYLTHHAQQLDQLIILGDFFEVWVGDDHRIEWIESIRQRLLSLTQQGTDVYFCHGNRDFLVGETFAQSANIKLMEEHQPHRIGSTDVLLCHGDSLCTDDDAFMAFRKESRSQAWQHQFLSLPLEQRITIARGYREQSKAAQANKTLDIMDVNQQAVAEVFERFNVNTMIHGHTHRPALHPMGNKQRIVLSDWGKEGNFVSINDSTIRMFYFDTDQLREDEAIRTQLF